MSEPDLVSLGVVNLGDRVLLRNMCQSDYVHVHVNYIQDQNLHVYTDICVFIFKLNDLN